MQFGHNGKDMANFLSKVKKDIFYEYIGEICCKDKKI